MYAMSLPPPVTPVEEKKRPLPKLRSEPLATQKQVIQLAKKAKKGDLAARDEVIRANMGFVYQTANRLNRSTSFPVEDLVQEGVLGLLRALELFDPSLGYTFLTYASNWVLQFMTRHIEKSEAVLEGTYHLIQRFRRALREHDRLILAGTSPEDALVLVARKTKQKPHILKEHFEALRGLKMSSLDTVVSTPGSDGTGSSLLDIIPNPDEWRPEDLDLSKRDERVKTVARRLRMGLNDIERAILDHRLLPEHDDRKTLNEIGLLVSRTRERIRQVEAKVVEKLERALQKDIERNGALL